MRSSMAEKLEKILAKCNSMKEIRDMATRHPDLRENLADSLENVK